MKFGVILPFFGPADQLDEALKNLEKMIDYPRTKVFLVFDGVPELADRFDPRKYDLDIHPLRISKNVEFVHAANFGYSIARIHCHLFIVWGADCRITEKGFVSRVVKSYQGHFPRGGGLLCLNDGYWNGDLALHPVFDQAFVDWLEYESEGIFHPAYIHYGADNEITERAKLAGRYAYDPSLVHYHPEPSDRAGYESSKHKKADAKTLLNRREGGFGS